jgi:membrane-associated protease RseP (regulator of RpoE activity)
VSDCVVAAKPGQTTVRACRDSDPVAPAKEAGLRPGDRITALNGEEVTAWDQVTGIIRANAGGRMEIAFVRDGEPMTAVTNTRVSDRPSLTDRDEVEKVGFLGVVPSSELVRQGPGYVVTTMAANTWATIEAIGTLPVKLYHVGRAAIGLEERAEDSPMSVVGASRAAGEFTSAHEIPLVDRLFWLVGLLGALNLFLGMFNFVPLLPLDGGHIAGALYEAARRGVARVFRRPDPGYFDTAKLLPVAYVMAGAIAVMSVVLIYADIVIPIRVTG